MCDHLNREERYILKTERFSMEYRTWLMNLIDPESRYDILLSILYDTEFKWVLDRDEDRAADGRNLRYYCSLALNNAKDFEQRWLDWPCSLLEMFVGLSFAIEDYILYDSTKGDRTVEWFWMILHNLGLDVFDDKYILECGCVVSDIISETCNRFMNRVYDADGFGGAFPLDAPCEDQNEVELWYQANQYILEKSIT